MQATAVVPIKRFDAAKQRLSDVLAPADRALLAAAMAADVLEQLAESELIDRVIVVSGEPEVAVLAAKAGVEIVEDPADAGHSEAAMIGVAAAEAKGADCGRAAARRLPAARPGRARPGAGGAARRTASASSPIATAPAPTAC